MINVRFVDQTTAASGGLISEKNGVVYLAPDSSNVAPSGRQSVRLESKDSYNEVLIIADFSHLPQAYLSLYKSYLTAVYVDHGQLFGPPISTIGPQAEKSTSSKESTPTL